jgi:hypothetical protein
MKANAPAIAASRSGAAPRASVRPGRKCVAISSRLTRNVTASRDGVAVISA